MYCSLEFPSCGRPVFTTAVGVGGAITAPTRADQACPWCRPSTFMVTEVELALPSPIREVEVLETAYIYSKKATAWG